MATYGDLVDRVLVNLGESSNTDTDFRAEVLEHLKELTRTDLPNRAGGPYLQGYADVSLSASTSEYDVPATLRSFDGPFLWNDDRVWSDQRQIYYDPEAFWNDFIKMTDEAEPTAVLIHGRKLTFKKTPDASYTARMYGTVWADVSAYTEYTTAEVNYEACLVAGATLLVAAAKEREEVIAVWSPIWLQRLAGLKGGSDAWQTGNQHPKEF